MGALIGHLVESLVAFGCGLVSGPIVGWALYWKESRRRYVVSALVGTFLIMPHIGLPGVLEAFVVITLVIAIVTCVVLAVISRCTPWCRKILDALDARREEAGASEH